MFSKNFSEKFLENIIKIQETLFKKALNLLSSNGVLVYSTCSILKDENEKILEKYNDLFEIIPIEKFEDNNIKFLPSLDGTLTICPNSYFEGFFIAKLRKIN